MNCTSAMIGNQKWTALLCWQEKCYSGVVNVCFTKEDYGGEPVSRSLLMNGPYDQIN